MTEPTFRLADQQFDPAIPVGSIQEHPDNYNEGDVGAVAMSLDSHGFYGGVLVQRSTGNIIAGNTRYRTAVIKGAETIPGFWVECDDGEAEEILAVDNRTAALARVDEARLVELLTRRATSERGLAGTGYDGDDLDGLIMKLRGKGPPEEFRPYGDDIKTEYECPRCLYRWSGAPDTGGRVSSGHDGNVPEGSA
jgi:hypothetical protein